MPAYSPALSRASLIWLCRNCSSEGYSDEIMALQLYVIIFGAKRRHSLLRLDICVVNDLSVLRHLAVNKLSKIVRRRADRIETQYA